MVWCVNRRGVEEKAILVVCDIHDTMSGRKTRGKR